MSWSAGTGEYSEGAGLEGVVGDALAAPAAAPGALVGAPVPGAAPAVDGAVAPVAVGGGADALVVTGRLAHAATASESATASAKTVPHVARETIIASALPFVPVAFVRDAALFRRA
jgi:hypothetical protein